MTIIYFIRHGKTKQNMMHLIQGRMDYPLSKEGIDDVRSKALLYKEKGLSFDAIYSSPLSRAFESAKIFKDVFKHQEEIIIDDSLIERDFGEAEGLIITDEIYERVSKNDFNKMEKNDEIEKRMYDATIKIAKENPEKNILVLCHSHSIKAVMCAVDKNRWFTDPLRNVSLTIFSYDEGKLRLLADDIIPEEDFIWKF